MLIFLLFLVFCSSLVTKGVYYVGYPSSTDCSGDHIVTKYASECVGMKNPDESVVFTCSDSGLKNVSESIYVNDDCSGNPYETAFMGNAGVCYYQEDSSEVYYCIDDYKVDYSFLEWGIPFNFSNPDIGKHSLMAYMYMHATECYQIPYFAMKYYVTTICDDSGSQSVMKMYSGSTCENPPLYTLNLNDGDIINFGKYFPHIDVFYMKYMGCKNN